MSEQLTFDLPTRPALERGDFFIANSNALALAMIEDCENWPQNKHLLVGPRGSGKTHLANVWANQRGARVIASRDITYQAVEEYAAQDLVIDDVPSLLGEQSREATLFHIHNLCLANDNALLMTGTGDVSTWNCVLPDLASRLNGTRTARLDPPDDILFQALLAKLFADRQLFPPPDVFPYLLLRLERSYDAAQMAVNQIDRAALSRKRAITRSFVASIIDDLTTA
jgi:chromosomal replication initiation ATPase DnaA